MVIHEDIKTVIAVHIAVERQHTVRLHFKGTASQIGTVVFAVKIGCAVIFTDDDVVAAAVVIEKSGSEKNAAGGGDT